MDNNNIIYNKQALSYDNKNNNKAIIHDENIKCNIGKSQ